MYLNIFTYMLQQMQLMYTEKYCFGENKWIQKIAQNTQNYILRCATKSRSQIFAADAAKKKHALAGVTGKNDAHLQLFFASNADQDLT